jgi:NAD-dependent deacetylase
VDGLYNQKYDYPPEQILSHGFFYSHTEEFYKFYRDKILLSAEPNAAHYALTLLQRRKNLTVITQNIDGLHQKAGNEKVFELHGTVEKNHCVKCGKFFPLSFVKRSYGVPRCDECGSIVKPDVVLYGEGLDDETVSGAIAAISRADTLIVAGTSLSVYPAAGFVGYFGGENSVIINTSPTPYDRSASMSIPAKVGVVLKKATEKAFL